MGTFQATYSPHTSPDGETFVDANDIYGKLLYYPRADIGGGGQTYESLNGGVDYRHFSPFSKITDGLEAGCFRSGAFARGYNYGFNFPDRYNASTYVDSTLVHHGMKPSDRLFHVHQSFAVRFFCPWPATCFIGYQGWFASELAKFEGRKFGERWDLKLRINGNIHAGSYVKVPATKNSGKKGSGFPTEKSSHEWRWRWLQRTLQFKAKRGFNTIEVLNWPRIKKEYADNDKRATPKMVTLCGGIWVVAVRLGVHSDEYDEDNQTGHKTQLPYNGGEGTNTPFKVPKYHPDFDTKDVEQMISVEDADFSWKGDDREYLSEGGQEQLESLYIDASLEHIQSDPPDQD